MHPPRLSDLLKNDEIIVAPGAYDALSAKIAAQAGAKAVYLTGFGVAGSSLGLPDVGLMTASELTDRVQAMAAAAAPVPLLADGDNGHGGPLNVARLVRAYEAAGAQCIQLEDQVFPKRCGHMENKEVVPTTEAASKIQAAVDARDSADFKVMARTDARGPLGFDEALKRGEAFLKAGADILFVEAPVSIEEMEEIVRAFGDMPLVANMVEDGKTPYLDAEALQQIGFKIAIFPVSALLCVTKRLQDVYGALLANDQLPETEPRVRFDDYNRIVGLPEMLAAAAALDQRVDE